MADMQLLETGKERLRFEELKLPVGERVQLETRSGPGRYNVRFVGCFADRGLLLSLPTVRGAPRLPAEGTPVTLRFMALNRACAFASRVQKAQLAPLPLLYLDYPGEGEAVKVRKATRVRSRLIVSLDEVEEGALGGGWPRQAICADISLHGARIEASDLLGEVDEELFMTARVKVGAIDQVLLVRCLIRNLEELDDPYSGEYRIVHGVEFFDLDEETQLILTGFVYQQMLREQVGI